MFCNAQNTPILFQSGLSPWPRWGADDAPHTRSRLSPIAQRAWGLRRLVLRAFGESSFGAHWQSLSITKLGLRTRLLIVALFQRKSFAIPAFSVVRIRIIRAYLWYKSCNLFRFELELVIKLQLVWNHVQIRHISHITHPLHSPLGLFSSESICRSTSTVNRTV